MKYILSALIIFGLSYDAKAQDNPSHTSVIYHSQNQNKINALMGIGLFSSPPLIETWNGNSDTHVIHGNIVQGADGIWETSDNSIIDRSIHGARNRINLGVNDNNRQKSLIGMWKASVGFDGQEHLYPNDERLIFEALIYLSSFGEYDNSTLFVGLVETRFNSFPSDSLSSIIGSETYRRFGFSMEDTLSADGQLKIRGISANFRNVSITNPVEIIKSSWVHVSAVYDIGTNISFYIDGAMVGVPIIENLPSGNFSMHPVFSLSITANGVGSRRIIIGQSRFYFQNGQ